MQHKDVGTGSNHIIHNYQFADIAQRDQFVGTEADLLKVCLVLTPFSYYTLSSINPIKWEQFGGGTSGSGNSEVIEVIRSNENPTITTNPSEKGILWVNYATNEIFVCIDNTYDNNIWKGNQKTIISKNKIYQYDILNDYTCIAFFQLDDNLIDMGGAFQISTYNADYEIGKMGKCLKMNFTNCKIELYSKVKSISFWAGSSEA